MKGRVVVCGAGGFIGSHLVRRFTAEGAGTCAATVPVPSEIRGVTMTDAVVASPAFTTPEVWRWAIASVMIAVAALLLAHPVAYSPYVEGRDYVRMAEGHYESAYFYYAGRVFHPWLAGTLSGLLTIPVTDSFRLITFAVVPVLVFCATYPLRRFSLSTQLTFGALLILNPITITAVQNYYFHDLLFQAIIALFLMCFSVQPWAALLLLPALVLTRETGVIVAVIAAVIALTRKRPALAFTILLITVPSFLLAHHMVAGAQPNKHGLGALTTDVLKIPYNVLHNFFGIVVWTNTNVETTTCAPRFLWDVAALHLGQITKIGVCDWDATLPLSTALLIGTSFGFVPLALLTIRDISAVKRASSAFVIAVFTGASMLILAPLIGTAVSRYIIYVSPLCWAALPSAATLLTKHWRGDIQRIGLIGLNLALMWSPAALVWVQSRRAWCFLAIAILSAVVYIGIRLAAILRAESHILLDGYA